ncbi:flagellar hook-associated protein FlgK [Litoreibacter sp.]|nr:flagellar hook-associated protein FlgK [Litoreibacter sp.]
MSLTSALSNARSGLAAATRSAEIVSSNVANALTEGYGRRELALSSAVLGRDGAGVRISGVERVVNQVAINERRLADAAHGFARQDALFYGRLEAALGSPETATSLTGRIATLEASLVAAAASPQSLPQLGAVASAAQNLAQSINSASGVIRAEREAADRSIGDQVALINSNLSAVADINDQIRTQSTSGFDTSALKDQRQQLIDQISDLIPIKEIPRDHERVALITTNGTILVEDHAAQFGFETTPTIVPEMTLATGALSGLTISGAGSLVGSALSAISGGTLAATFAVRDQTSVDAQAQLDGLARDLIERTSDPLVDSTLAGGAGLFSDADAPFNPTTETGLASRLSVNSRVDPAQGGEYWRIRDGIGAVIQGPPGDISTLSSLADTMRATSSFSSKPPFSSTASAFQSTMGAARFQSESDVAFSLAQVTAFGDAERSVGVDTDQEMQKLLSIEQSYAANAKVIEAIDQMMQSLLRI